MTMTDIARVRCAYCGELFSPSRFDNQHQRANAPAIASSLYCRPACKQAAYRRRKDIAAGIPASARRHRPPKARLRPRGSVTQAQNSVPDSLCTWVRNTGRNTARKSVICKAVFGDRGSPPKRRQAGFAHCPRRDLFRHVPHSPGRWLAQRYGELDARPRRDPGDDAMTRLTKPRLDRWQSDLLTSCVHEPVRSVRGGAPTWRNTEPNSHAPN
jgi:hypothetical protein